MTKENEEEPLDIIDFAKNIGETIQGKKSKAKEEKTSKGNSLTENEIERIKGKYSREDYNYKITTNNIYILKKEER